MAKSLRSKTKRAFRRVKREDSAFAVAHSARLERLSKKMEQVRAGPPPDQSAGWFPFLLFGLVDQEDIALEQTPTNMLNLMAKMEASSNWWS
jgi:hypothetical protein